MRALALALAGFVAACGGSATGGTTVGPTNTPGDNGNGGGGSTPGGGSGGTPGTGNDGGATGGGMTGGGGSDGGMAFAWTMETSGTTADLRAVWAGGSTQVFAAGASGTLLRSRGDGAWTVVRANAGDGDVFSMWGVSPTELYLLALDAGGGDVVLHSLDGGATVAHVAVGGHSEFEHIWGLDADHVFVTNGNVFRSTDHGATWLPFAQPPATWRGGYRICALWGSSANDLYLVGQGGPTPGTTNRQLALHSTDGGQTFTIAGDLSVSGTLNSTWGSGPGDVWVSGVPRTILRSTDGGQTHTDVMPSTTGVACPLQVWGTGSNDVYVLACNGTSDSSILLHTRDGGVGWDQKTVPLNGRAGFSVGPADIYVVGDGGRILHGH